MIHPSFMRSYLIKFVPPFILENSSTGEPQLVVKLEVNGILFEGVLFPNPSNSSPASASTTPSTEPMISPVKHSSPNRNSLNDDHKLTQQMVSSS